MPLSNKTKPADAKEMKTEAEGEDPATFAVHDKDGEWFVASTPHVLIDPESGTRFVGGVPTRAKRTGWVDAQIRARAMAEAEAPAEAKGKAATTPTPGVDETAKPQGEQGSGPGMQSTVLGS